MWAMFYYEEQETINIVGDSEGEMTIKQMAEIVNKVSGNQNELEFLTQYSDGQNKKTTSDVKLKSYLKGFKMTSLEEGLMTTYEWFKSTYPNVRGVDK